MTMKTYDTFEAWLKDQTSENQKIAKKLCRIVLKAAPKLIETSKWGNGVWIKGELPLLFVHGKSDHLQFGFFAGALLSDPKKIMVGRAKFVRHIPLKSLSNIDEAALSTMIRKAVRAPNYR